MRLLRMVLLSGLLFSSLVAQSKQGSHSHWLQVIVFESYLTPTPNTQEGFDVIELPSNDFPMK